MLTDGSEIRNNDLKKLKITEEDVGERKGSPLIWKDDLYTKIPLTNIIEYSTKLAFVQ